MADRMCRTHPPQKRAVPPRRRRLALIRTPDSGGLYRPSISTRGSRHTSGTRSRPSKLDHSNPSRPPQWPRSRPDITDRAGRWPRFGIVGLAGLAVRRPSARCFSAQRGGRREDDPSHCCRPICCRCRCAGSGVRMEQVCRDGFSVHRRVTGAAEQACASAQPFLAPSLQTQGRLRGCRQDAGIISTRQPGSLTAPATSL